MSRSIDYFPYNSFVYFLEGQVHKNKSKLETMTNAGKSHFFKHLQCANSFGREKFMIMYEKKLYFFFLNSYFLGKLVDLTKIEAPLPQLPRKRTLPSYPLALPTISTMFSSPPHLSFFEKHLSHHPPPPLPYPLPSAFRKKVEAETMKGT